MAYRDKFDRTIELVDISEAQQLVIEMIMREGELRFRDAFIEVLQNDIAGYLDEIKSEPNMDWVNGVQYVIHLLKEAEVVR